MSSFYKYLKKLKQYEQYIPNILDDKELENIIKELKEEANKTSGLFNCKPKKKLLHILSEAEAKLADIRRKIEEEKEKEKYKHKPAIENTLNKQNRKQNTQFSDTSNEEQLCENEADEQLEQMITETPEKQSIKSNIDQAICDGIELQNKKLKKTTTHKLR